MLHSLDKARNELGYREKQVEALENILPPRDRRPPRPPHMRTGH
jgi:hypothetical protein